MAKGGKRKAAAGDVATNRQASFRYELLGKAIRLGDRVRVTVGRIDAPRGRVDLYPVEL